MQAVTINEILNIFSLSAFSIISFMILLRIGYRTLLFRRAKVKLPVLLRRDLYLFLSISLYIISLLALRASGFTNLSSHIEWILFSNTLLLGPFSYWAWVEWNQ